MQQLAMPLLPDPAPVHRRILHATLQGVSWAGAHPVQAINRLEDLRIAAELYGDSTTAALARQGQDLICAATRAWDLHASSALRGNFGLTREKALQANLINPGPSPYGVHGAPPGPQEEPPCDC